MRTQVIPQFVNQPKKSGGKYGNIKTADDTRYMVPVNHLGSFQTGQATNIDFVVQDWRDGPVNVVVEINGTNITGQAANAQGHVPAGDRPSPAPQNVPQSSPEEGMFVMGVVGRAMGSGQFGMSDIPLLAKIAVKAWNERHQAPRTMKGAAPEQSGWVAPERGQRVDRDLDDEIPL